MIDAMAAAAAGVVGGVFSVSSIPRMRTFISREDDAGKVKWFAFHEWPRGKPFGLLVHSTGPGMEKLSRVRGLSRFDTVARVYGNPSMTCAHGVVLPSGERVRVVDSKLVAPHCGVKAWQRKAMLDGTWVAWTSDEAEALFAKRWPGVKSPQHLFPTASPNDAYEGLESWKLAELDPYTGSFYTLAQYQSTAQWVVERERAWGFVAEGRRLVTHDDVQPFERWDAHGGRDPGAMREPPFYRWDLLLACIDHMRKAGSGSL